MAVGAVLVACFATAFFCGFELRRIGWGVRMMRRSLEIERRHPVEQAGEPEGRDERIEIREDQMARWLTVILVASLTIAATTAVADGKVTAPFDRDPDKPSHSDQSETLGAQERAAFDGKITKRYEVPRKARSKRLCLMRYGERGFGDSRLSGKWWTSCRIAQTLATVTDVKEDLALPARFGAVRDARVKAVMPAGTLVTYYEGLVAPQCEHPNDELPCHSHRYQGGRLAVLLPAPGSDRGLDHGGRMHPRPGGSTLPLVALRRLSRQAASRCAAGAGSLAESSAGSLWAARSS